ncbi:MAG: CoA ester lyase [Chloroflexi bacterium]|nr:CoA ester lyase [Chloroflexota bacterium]
MLFLRSLLFVPGNQERRIEKARSVAADALILDLEDSVPPAEKEAARQMVATASGGLVSKGRVIFVRVNALTTAYAIADIQTVVTKGLGGILLPKSESAADIRRADSLIAEAERKAGLEAGSVRLLALVESPKGVINAYEIATASPRLAGMTFGAEDYALEMGITRTKEGGEICYPRQVISVACHAANVLAIDCVFTGVRDPEGLVAETRLARQMGFQGKLVIHPDQIGPVNEIFVPPADEIDYARRVLEVYEAAVAEGKAAATLDGKMIDTPVAEKAKKLLALVEAIAKR